MVNDDSDSIDNNDGSKSKYWRGAHFAFSPSYETLLVRNERLARAVLVHHPKCPTFPVPEESHEESKKLAHGSS